LPAIVDSEPALHQLHMFTRKGLIVTRDEKYARCGAAESQGYTRVNSAVWTLLFLFSPFCCCILHPVTFPRQFTTAPLHLRSSPQLVFYSACFYFQRFPCFMAATGCCCQTRTSIAITYLRRCPLADIL